MVIGIWSGLKMMRAIELIKTLNDPTLDNEKNFYSKVCEANGKGVGGAEVELGALCYNSWRRKLCRHGNLWR